jgi:transcription termination factor Rho
MHLSELKSQHVSALIEMANGLEIENANRLRKQELMFAILKKRAKTGDTIFGDGTLEVLPDGFGFLRSPETSYLASTDDIYISPSQIRRFNLHTGDTIEGEVRTPKDGERYFRAGEGRQGQRPAAGSLEAQDHVRKPDAAASEQGAAARA